MICAKYIHWITVLIFSSFTADLINSSGNLRSFYSWRKVQHIWKGLHRNWALTRRSNICKILQELSQCWFGFLHIYTGLHLKWVIFTFSGNSWHFQWYSINTTHQDQLPGHSLNLLAYENSYIILLERVWSFSDSEADFWPCQNVYGLLPQAIIVLTLQSLAPS